MNKALPLLEFEFVRVIKIQLPPSKKKKKNTVANYQVNIIKIKMIL